MEEKKIILQYRKPRNKSERGVYGRTYVNEDKAEIFINSNRNKKTSWEFVKTPIHEVIHAVLMFYGPKVKRRYEEAICRSVENSIEGFLRYR